MNSSLPVSSIHSILQERLLKWVVISFFTLLAERGKELSSLLMKMKVESEKIGLKLKIQKTNIMASSPITSRQINKEIMETVTYFFFLVGGGAP